jgi:hypothetical protein
MKKNLILAIVLVLGLVFTYLFQEKNFFTKSVLLFSKIEVLNLSTTKVNINLMENEFKTSSNLVVSAKKWQDFLEWLNSITIESEFDENKNYSNFFSNPIKFSVNKVEYVVGDLHPNSEFFYLKKSNDPKIMVARFDRPALTMSEDEEQLDRDRYLSFINFLTQDEMIWIEPQLLKHLGIDFNRVNYTGAGREPFSLYLEADTTAPSPLVGLSAKKDIEAVWMSYFETIMFTSVLANVPTRDPLSVIELEASDKKLTLNLYHGETEISICVPEKSWCFNISPPGAKVFFLTLEDFWNLAPVSDLNELGFNMTIGSGETRVPILVDRRYKEHFKNPNPLINLNQDAWTELLKFFEMIEPYKVYKASPCKKIKSAGLAVVFQEKTPEEKEFIVYQTKNLLIAKNTKTNICHHYLKNLDQKLSLREEDYFTSLK